MDWIFPGLSKELAYSDSGFVTFAAITGLVLGTSTLACYAYGLFFFSRYYAETHENRTRQFFIFAALLTFGTSVGVCFISINPYLKIFLSITLFLVHAVPMTSGYLTGRENAKRARAEAIEQNTMKLLMEWEREHLVETNEYQE